MTKNINKSNYYIVNPFVIHKLPNSDIVIQNKHGIISIVEKKMKNMLQKVEDESIEKILIEKIIDIFGENAETAIQFLLDNRIFKINQSSNFNITGISFFSNNSSIDKLISRAFENNKEVWHGYGNDVESYIESIQQNQKQLYVVFLNPYDKVLARKLRNLFKDNANTYSIITYVYNSHLYIDAIYSSVWKSPCHLCHLGYIESELRLGSHQKITYQQIVDYLFIEDQYFKPEMPLDFSSALNISTQIINRIEKLVGLQSEIQINLEEYTKGVVMDIKTREFYLDTTHHWELCDCYE